MIRRLVATMGVVGLVLTLSVEPASSQAPDAQGWWWIAGGSPLAPPFVPADGLYVASNPTGTEAVSALRFTLGDQGAGDLKLMVEGETRGEPVVGLCVIGGNWEPVQGGNLSDAPPYDCAKGAVAGTIAPDGTSVTFPTSSLVRAGVLNVAIVPGESESGSPTFQMAFAKPGGDALAPGPASASTNPLSSEPQPTETFSSDARFESAPASSSFQPLPPAEPLVVPPTDPSTGVVPSTQSGGGGVAAPVASRQVDDDDSSSWRIIGLALLAATAFAYHKLSTTADRTPRSLVSFGALRTEEQT